ncbi:trypsin-like peptidase domain-containing protein [Gordonia humi]|uniref:Putative serine protease PepD n=1 Tax=Gordonia humi TaxID=686429 RepID=A0A840F4Z7_9ACTN|nr:trypsin-like peptidase domain-containing protein [Gordonia humi]MBB4137714.1 putative serine protease PepD [Gordonia humi]
MNDGAYRDTSAGNDDFTGQQPASPNPYSQGQYGENPFGRPTSTPGTGGFGAQPYGAPAAPQSPQPTTPYAGAPYSGQGTGQFGSVPPNPPPTSPFGGAGDGSGGGGGKRGNGGKKFLVGAAAVVVLAGAAGAGAGALVANSDGASSAPSTSVAAGATETAQPTAAPGSVQETANRVLPSVVSILVSDGRQEGSGSGVVLDSDGVILTNNHVVAGAQQVLVTFNDGSRAPAKVLGADPVSDIAVIKADKTGLTPITIGASKNLSVGQDVIAIGSPLGLAGTVTTGIISALNRPVSTSGTDGSQESVIDAIQTDAAINPGNSGGALINASGALIGINTAIATTGAEGESGSIGLGFAIPIDQAMRVAKELQASGKATQASLGVSVRPNTDVEKPGALVASVVRGGAAEKAGIPNGALITGVDDRKISTSEALVAAIRSYAPNDTVKVTYSVRDQSKTAEATLGTM